MLTADSIKPAVVVVQKDIFDPTLVNVGEKSVFGIRVDTTPDDVLPVEPIGEEIGERRLSDATFLSRD
jgi:hypothetical protein